jgi:hypothetical protein
VKYTRFLKKRRRIGSGSAAKQIFFVFAGLNNPREDRNCKPTQTNTVEVQTRGKCLCGMRYTEILAKSSVPKTNLSADTLLDIKTSGAKFVKEPASTPGVGHQENVDREPGSERGSER